MTKPILCLDFDGVVHSYTSGWKDAAVIPDPHVPGFFEFLEEAVKVFDVQIFSSRSHQEGGIAAMSAWLIRERAAWREAGGRGSQVVSVSFPTNKPSAMVSIDDRAITFTGTWPPVSWLAAFVPWNRRAEVPSS